MSTTIFYVNELKAFV